MMSGNRKSQAIAVLALVAVGCANSSSNSNFKLASQQRSSLHAVTDDRVMNAPLEHTPKILPDTHIAAARMFEAQGDAAKAIQQYRKAIAVNHRNMAAHQRLGYLLGQTGQHGEAIEVLGRAVTLDPNNAALRNNLGFELMHAQRWAEAEAELRFAIRQKANFRRAHVNLAMVLSQTDRFAEALAEFESVLPETDSHYNMGLLFRGRQRYDEARASFERVLALNPAFSPAVTQLSEIAPHLVPPSAAVARVEEPTTQAPDHDPEEMSGFTVVGRFADAEVADLTIDGPPAEWIAPTTERAAEIDNRIDIAEEEDLDAGAAVSLQGDPTVEAAATEDPATNDWKIPFGLSLARRLSEVRAEGDAIAVERIGTMSAESSREVAALDAEISLDSTPEWVPSGRVSRNDPIEAPRVVGMSVTESREPVVEDERDPWTESWIEELRVLDSRLTVVRNQIVCLDEEVARNHAELAAVEGSNFAADEESDATAALIDETGVYVKVLEMSGSVEFGDIDSSPAITDYSLAEPEGVYSSAPAEGAIGESEAMDERSPSAVPVRYEERERSKKDPRNQGTYRGESPFDEVGGLLAVARNEIRCQDVDRAEVEAEAVDGEELIASWPEFEAERSWCERAESPLMCDPLREDDGEGELKSSQTSMHFARPLDPRRVRPMAD